MEGYSEEEEMEQTGVRWGESMYHEKPFEHFFCPLTKQIMRDPVTIESGHAFEREAILKWFKECRDAGRRPTCPLTQKELGSTALTSSIALRNVIEEWRKRNEEKDLESARNSLSLLGSNEMDALTALEYVLQSCRQNAAKKDAVRKYGMIQMVADMMKSSHRRVRLKALEVLRTLADGNDDNKEEMEKGDTVRTVVKFLSHEHYEEREQAVSVLYELSMLDSACEKIGSVYGTILMLVGMASSKTEHATAVQRAESTLRNLEKWEPNIKQMAENGRLQPLLDKLQQGSLATQLSMAEYLGELALANDVKVEVAQQAGPLLVTIMRTGSQPAREATLKVLREVSSNEASAKLLLDAGLLPPLILDLFSIGSHRLPPKLKEMSATILANLVSSDGDFRSIPLDEQNQTLLSESMVHSLLHLISNNGPAIESQLLQVLVKLTSSPPTVTDIVSGIRSSGAVISLIQFIEAPHREIRVAALKLLRNISPHMGKELADELGGNANHLSTLVRIISDNNGIMEEQTAAVSLLADLPERDARLTRQLFDLNAFAILATKLAEARAGTIRTNRYFTPFLEGLVRIIFRATTYVSEHQPPEYLEFAQEKNLAGLFADLLQMNGVDKVQIFSAMALQNLSRESARLTKIPDPAPPAGLCGLCKPSRPPHEKGVCRVHCGFCSLRETFCLLEGKVVDKLVACLDHLNEKVVEAALAALSTLLSDEVNVAEGVVVLCDAEGVRAIMDILVESRSEALQQAAVWAVERVLRLDDLAREVAADQSVAAALVEAYRNGDRRTRQIAERALKHLDKIPQFSSTVAGAMK